MRKRQAANKVMQITLTVKNNRVHYSTYDDGLDLSKYPLLKRLSIVSGVSAEDKRKGILLYASQIVEMLETDELERGVKIIA